MAPVMPSTDGVKSRPFRDHRQVVEGVIDRFRTGIAWRDLPDSFGPWQTVGQRHHRFSTDGTWDKIHARLLAEADGAGEIDGMVSVDSTINRAHQHATNLPREPKQRSIVENDSTDVGSEVVAAEAVAGLLAPDTGGWIESQRSARSRRSAVA
jgi:transposase